MIAGENRDYASALAWLNPAEARKLLGRDPEPADGDLVTDPDLLRLLAGALAAYNAGHGSAARIERLLILASPASLDAGEITDKGYLNQRKVLTERAALVDLLYADPPRPESRAMIGPNGSGFPASRPGQKVSTRRPRTPPAASRRCASAAWLGGQHVGDPQRQHAVVDQAGQLARSGRPRAGAGRRGPGER